VKTSALISGSSELNMGFRIIRTKAIAGLLNPSRVGLLGIFDNISKLMRTVAGLGISTSGVWQIADAAGTGDARRRQ
jgi:enterobacterial common antigen flippase